MRQRGPRRARSWRALSRARSAAIHWAVDATGFTVAMSASWGEQHRTIAPMKVTGSRTNRKHPDYLQLPYRREHVTADNLRRSSACSRLARRALAGLVLHYSVAGRISAGDLVGGHGPGRIGSPLSFMRSVMACRRCLCRALGSGCYCLGLPTRAECDRSRPQRRISGPGWHRR